MYKDGIEKKIKDINKLYTSNRSTLMKDYELFSKEHHGYTSYSFIKQVRHEGYETTNYRIDVSFKKNQAQAIDYTKEYGMRVLALVNFKDGLSIESFQECTFEEFLKGVSNANVYSFILDLFGTPLGGLSVYEFITNSNVNIYQNTNSKYNIGELEVMQGDSLHQLSRIYACTQALPEKKSKHIRELKKLPPL